MSTHFEIFQPAPEVEVVEEKRKNYFYDFLKDISYKKEYIYDEDNKRDYTPYMINRFLSMEQSTVLYAQEMNFRCQLDKDMHYEYLMSAIRPMNRYFKYQKSDKAHADIMLLAEFYDINISKAREIFKIHTLDQMVEIQKLMNKGGADVKTRRKKSKS